MGAWEINQDWAILVFEMFLEVRRPLCLAHCDRILIIIGLTCAGKKFKFKVRFRLPVLDFRWIINSFRLLSFSTLNVPLSIQRSCPFPSFSVHQSPTTNQLPSLWLWSLKSVTLWAQWRFLSIYDGFLKAHHGVQPSFFGVFENVGIRSVCGL